jgi:threonine/homoserine/homoserine lactone efflux protein
VIEMIFVGMGYGLLLSLMVGPAFFVMIETSITKGIKSALFLDLGVLICDLFYVLIAFLFFKEVTGLLSDKNMSAVKMVGGAFFIILGLVHLLKKKALFMPESHISKPLELKASNYVMTMLKGFVLNAFNPGVLIYWLTLMSLLPAVDPDMDLSRTQSQIIYVVIIFITFFGIDVLKIVGAKLLKDILTRQWMYIINMVLGIILLIFGTFFLFQGIFAFLK